MLPQDEADGLYSDEEEVLAEEQEAKRLHSERLQQIEEERNRELERIRTAAADQVAQEENRKAAAAERAAQEAERRATAAAVARPTVVPTKSICATPDTTPPLPRVKLVFVCFECLAVAHGNQSQMASVIPAPIAAQQTTPIPPPASAPLVGILGVGVPSKIAPKNPYLLSEWCCADRDHRST
jgi:hypothetical protein